ncbi:endocytic adaptor protein [Nadsonia fulvescens var. elongata DSM 6958]|uniref:Endocytic adaptor protein n=1 Tax=Nadsonia fulvescens var. elongata DSM 6958 TaxID=857566 RepID=A0A1E3PT97_9ASCO|nr:endocytic adaptor protein [Nadsonia fulvescens var. elongata DSM 6958]
MSFKGSLSRVEADLSVSVRKATSIDETAPKRKHVRSCIVYTWDHRSSKAFWNGMRLQPLAGNDIQVFKALITIHKVLQEGHPSVLKDAQTNLNFIESLGRSPTSSSSYSKLIVEYSRFLLRKLHFHKNHPAFNGMFEYEEYISLRTINDPNEGYEAIMDLMNLQDAVEDFQKLVFSALHHGRSNECKISSLVPMIAESYGIYRFIVSMLRAMHATTNDDEALEPLRARFYSQHARLLDFYYDCSTLKYLTSIVTIPKLSQAAPNLFSEEDESGPSLPRRPEFDHIVESETASLATPSPPPVANFEQPQPVVDFWSTPTGQQQLQQQQQQYEAEQQRLQAEREAEQQQQQLLALHQQQQFEQQRLQQEEQQRQAHEALMRDQLQRHAQGRVAELEQDLLNLRGQCDRDQLLLQQYDQRVQALESELNQVMAHGQQSLVSKDEMISSIQEQVNTWKTKYEALAKLYSQLRQEHLDLLSKFKETQRKAASAQEAIDKREKLERDIKSKNLELADLIRERDRARYELDKSRGSQKDEIEKLERQLRITEDKLANAERSKGSDLSMLITKHNRELADLEEALRTKSRKLDEFESKFGNRGVDSELQEKLQEKESEYEVLQDAMDELERAYKDLALDKEATESAIDEQIDSVLLSQLSKLNDIVDAILSGGVASIQTSLYELDSPMQGGNQNSTAAYLLSIIEKASTSATDFAESFNDFLADGPNGDHAVIIKTILLFTSAVNDIVINAKGLARLARDDKTEDQLIDLTRESVLSAERFLCGLQSSELAVLGNDIEAKTDKVVELNIEVQTVLQTLAQIAESFGPTINTTKNKTNLDLGDFVDSEMNKAATAIALAGQRLSELLVSKPSNTFDNKVHESILSAAIAVTNAIAALIQAATESQSEIVNKGRGSASRTAFYAKHNRWTEGLVSAAKAVAGATHVLIEAADGVLSGNKTLEELIVASNEVAGATAQLVAASRVKADFMSKTQDQLEKASRAVSSACRSLVSQVQNILSSGAGKNASADVDYSKFTAHDYKTSEMEQQVEILKLENQLQASRKRLGDIRKFSYIKDAEEEEFVNAD